MKINPFHQQDTIENTARLDRLRFLADADVRTVKAWAKHVGLKHWHTSKGLIVGEQSQGCPLCIRLGPSRVK